MKGLSLDLLHTFASVVELGSFSAAAGKSGLTQPAVSLQIRQLETRLGVTLLERVGRRAKPTAAGVELLEHVGRIDTVVNAALDAVAPHKTGAAGRVRLGTGATACIFFLPAVLRQFRQNYPDVALTVTTGNTAEIVEAVEENTIDLGLVTLPVAGRRLQTTPVWVDEFVAVAPPDAALPQRINAAALAAMPMLLFEPGGNTRRIVDQWFLRSNIEFNPAMSLGSVEAIKELVGAGLGYAILPRMALQKEIASGALTVRSLTPRLYRRLAIVIRGDKRLYRPLGAMIDLIRNNAAA